MRSTLVLAGLLIGGALAAVKLDEESEVTAHE